RTRMASTVEENGRQSQPSRHKPSQTLPPHATLTLCGNATMKKQVSSRLFAYGYDDFFAQQLKTLPGDLLPARVVGQHRREWDVVTETEQSRAVLAGKRWSPGKHVDAAETQPTVGDWVAI